MMWYDVYLKTGVLYVNFQDSTRPEIPKQYFSFADVSFFLSLPVYLIILQVVNVVSK